MTTDTITDHGDLHAEGGSRRARALPGRACPFWHGGGCVVAGLKADLATTAGLAELLLRIRDELGASSPRSYGLVPPGLR